MIQVRSVPHGVNATVAGTFEPRQPAGGGNLVGRPGRIEVGEHGGAFALLLIDRAFSEPMLVRAGIDSPVVVLNWAGTLGTPRAPGVRSCLSAAQRRLCEARIAEMSA